MTKRFRSAGLVDTIRAAMQHCRMDAREDTGDDTPTMLRRLVRFASPAIIPIIVMAILMLIHWIEIVVGPIRGR